MGLYDKQKLVASMVAHEGLRLRAYKDSLGYWTIGIGHLIDPRKGGDTRFPCAPTTVITKERAGELLVEDVERSVALLDEKLPWWRFQNEVRRRALIELCFNMGIGRLGVDGLLSFRNGLKRWREGHYFAAAESFRGSLWAKQVGPNRTRTITNMIETGQDATLKEAA